METLILALLATPLVFSLVMAFLPKNTSYNVFAGLNLVSVAAVLVLSIMPAGDVLMSGDTAGALGLWFHLDSLGAIFVLLIGFIGFLAGLFSLPYVKADIEEGSMPAERANLLAQAAYFERSGNPVQAQKSLSGAHNHVREHPGPLGQLFKTTLTEHIGWFRQGSRADWELALADRYRV